MIAPFLLSLLMTAGPASGEDWTPFRTFVGTWTGTRMHAAGRVSVTRAYESVARHGLLVVSERVASDDLTWGLVRFDGVSGGFVLRRFAKDGSMTEMALSAASADGARLVFDTVADGAGAGAGAERITLERLDDDEFLERIEWRSDGTSVPPVSETRFRRKR